jgi:RNA polymerase sigma factor (sigma-70 family)
MPNHSVCNGKATDRSAAPPPIVMYFPGNRGRTEWKPLRSGDADLANETRLLNPSQLARFEQVILPHLDSAYNLARWLVGNDHDAEDVVQEAYLRAVKFFASFRGGDGRPWLLAIVRRVSYDRLERIRSGPSLTVFDEDLHSDPASGPDPVQFLLRQEDRELLRAALADLPVEFREVLVLRELEGLAYKEIAAIADLPPGTIMSRLARGRERLRDRLVKHLRERA